MVTRQVRTFLDRDLQRTVAMPIVHDARASITQLHPEHLFDKLGAGRLSPAERRQLDSHAAACDTCRFELLVRGDLALESLKQSRGRDLGGLLLVGADG